MGIIESWLAFDIAKLAQDFNFFLYIVVTSLYIWIISCKITMYYLEKRQKMQQTLPSDAKLAM
jgi:hypothetical protein